MCSYIFSKIEVFEIPELFIKTNVRTASKFEQIILPEDKYNLFLIIRAQLGLFLL